MESKIYIIDIFHNEELRTSLLNTGAPSLTNLSMGLQHYMQGTGSLTLQEFESLLTSYNITRYYIGGPGDMSAVNIL